MPACTCTEEPASEVYSKVPKRLPVFCTPTPLTPDPTLRRVPLLEMVNVPELTRITETFTPWLSKVSSAVGSMRMALLPLAYNPKPWTVADDKPASFSVCPAISGWPMDRLPPEASITVPAPVQVP